MGATGQPTKPGPFESIVRRRVLLLLLVLLVMAIGAATVVGLVARASGSSLDVSMSRCVIDADGSLTASGRIEGPNGAGVTVNVDFVDQTTGKLVDSAQASVDLSFGGIGGDSWQVSGSADTTVNQVVCRATARS